MTAVLASIALFIAFVGLWLASANTKKIDAGQRELKKQVTAELEVLKTDVDNRLASVNRRTEAVMGKLETLAQGYVMTKDMAQDLQQDVTRIRKDLDEVMLRVMPRQQGAPGSDQDRRDYG